MLRLSLRRMTPAKIILLSFSLLILTGSLLLTLPFATRDGQGAPFLDALFTATSATCVTGLVVHDTYTYWAPFGQLVILSLIQVGGLGVITMALAVVMGTGRKIGLRQRFIMQESISAPQMGGIVRQTRFILKWAALIELAGAGVMAIRFCPQFGLGKGLWFALFHSVSAFCNAGFDLMGQQAPFSSLTAYTGDPLVNLPIMALIIIGGIGFLTWGDLRENGLHFQRYRLQSKLALSTTLLLVLLPAILFYYLDFSSPGWAHLQPGERALAALFQSVTPRTAGFNTVDLTGMHSVSQMVTTVLMLVGGSPGSTAGGFKTTSLAVMVLCVQATFRGRESVCCFGRRIPSEVLRNASTLFLLYLSLFGMAGMAICFLDGVPLGAALYEAASAVGTVGLSLGVTPGLGTLSQMILVGLMLFGRVGGLTILYAIAPAVRPAAQLPQEKITVG